MKALARVIALLSPNCKEASRLQSQALDRKLPWGQRFGLQIHLLLCEWCRRYGKQIRLLRDGIHEHPDHLPEPVGEKLSQNARERIKQKLLEEEE
jgi:hypothetical protein